MLEVERLAGPGAAIVASMVFGSHLHGTTTPDSDFDRAMVFVPGGRSIALGTVVEAVRSGTKEDRTARNSADDVDVEAHSLKRFLAMVADGTPRALDMLFAPPSALLEPPSPAWREIAANRHRLVTRKTAGFVEYCRDQAKRYGLKGGRIHALRGVLAWLDGAIAEHGDEARLRDAAGHAGGIEAFIAAASLTATAVVPIPQKFGKPAEPHLECCGKRAPFAASLRKARETYAAQLERYGERARLAEANEGIDWKAVAHAVRVGHEALELLATGRITLPLAQPLAARVLAIKGGRVPYGEASAELEDLIARMEAAGPASALPDEADAGFIDDLVADAYGGSVEAWLRDSRGSRSPAGDRFDVAIDVRELGHVLTGIDEARSSVRAASRRLSGSQKADRLAEAASLDRRYAELDRLMDRHATPVAATNEGNDGHG